MVRVTLFSALLALVFQSASAQVLNSAGPPASALSPNRDGSSIGIPAGATSPRPAPPTVFPPFQRQFIPGHLHQPLRQFGTNRHRGIVPQVPIFYPIYVYGAGYDNYAYPSVADPAVSQEVQPEDASQADATARSEDALRQAYMKGAHDALVEEQRGRQQARDYAASRSKAPAPQKQPAVEEQAPEPDNSPSTVFIFKDGHQLETKNFAIMGQTLYDLSTSVVKKVQLADLDKPATVKANDDRGITVKLP